MEKWKTPERREQGRRLGALYYVIACKNSVQQTNICTYTFVHVLYMHCSDVHCTFMHCVVHEWLCMMESLDPGLYCMRDRGREWKREG